MYTPLSTESTEDVETPTLQSSPSLVTGTGRSAIVLPGILRLRRHFPCRGSWLCLHLRLVGIHVEG